MLDLIYIALSLGFFALMLAYVHACARMGRSAPAEDASRGAPSPMDSRVRGNGGERSVP